MIIFFLYLGQTLGQIIWLDFLDIFKIKAGDLTNNPFLNIFLKVS